MTTTLLTRVKSKLFVHARRKSRSLLEGEYASVFHGRSLDYDDLRDYVPGDEVRDIDWRATARHQAPLVKRYVATRKQNLMLVIDTGRGMAALTRSGEPKKSVAITAAGLVGYLAQRHGDLVGLVARHGRVDRRARPARLGGAPRAAAARRRRRAPSSTATRATSRRSCAWIVRNVRRRLVLLVVADDKELDPALDELLRRLHVQHEILWITVEDADPTAIGRRPDGIRRRRHVHPADARCGSTRGCVTAYAASVRPSGCGAPPSLLDRRGINHARVGSSDEVVAAVFALLERQRRARR